MKHPIHILLAGPLAFGPLACSRDNVAPDQSVSANADRTGETENRSAEPSNAGPRRSEASREPSRAPTSRVDTRPAENRETERVVTEPRPAAPVRDTQNVPAESTLTVVLLDPLSTATNKAGDTFAATLADPIIVNGK